MKKIILIIVTVCIVSLNMALADSTIKENLLGTRENLGNSLNETVSILKNQIRVVDSKSKEQNTEIKTLYDTAEKLKNRSDDSEINPTVLKHGFPTIDSCLDDEELKWNGKTWKCIAMSAKIDCSANTWENKECDKDGNNCTCFISPKYENKDLSWGPCYTKFGEKYTHVACMFTADKKNEKKELSYQVDNSKCDYFQRYQKACGPDGEKSDCGCKKEEEYYYDSASNKSYCLGAPTCAEGFNFENGICIKPGDFSESAAVGGYEVREFERHFNYYPQHFYIHAWTEDLLAHIKFTADSGRVLFDKYYDRYKESKNHDHIKRSIYADFVVDEPGTLYFWLKEGGRGPSDELGYTIKLIDDTGAKCENPKSEYNETIQKCMNDVPVCNYPM